MLVSTLPKSEEILIPIAGVKTNSQEQSFRECPICCLPLPIDPGKSTLNLCCCKAICRGCNYANKNREIEEGLEQRCPFCREPVPDSDADHNKRIMERIKKNDPVAITSKAKVLRHGGDMGKHLNI